MEVVNLILYDDCQKDQWHSNYGPSINSVEPDNYLSYNTAEGLYIINAASKEMAGGLISNDYPFPQNCTYFGMDIMYKISEYDFPHLARNEMDLKITVKSGASGAIKNQANGSAQQNFSKNGMWQFDPTGTGWVDTGFDPGLPSMYSENIMQFRYFTDGETWSVTGLNFNGETFTPGKTFQNLPMISTNWGAGLHPQLQTEVQGAPWFLRQNYTKIRILASANPISWI